MPLRTAVPSRAPHRSHLLHFFRAFVEQGLVTRIAEFLCLKEDQYPSDSIWTEVRETQVELVPSSIKTALRLLIATKMMKISYESHSTLGKI
jgi:hypothetical protein